MPASMDEYRQMSSEDRQRLLRSLDIRRKAGR
jgi:hypothetical protein